MYFYVIVITYQLFQTLSKKTQAGRRRTVALRKL